MTCLNRGGLLGTDPEGSQIEAMPPLCFDALWGLALSLASTARADCAAGVTKGLSAGISGYVASDSTCPSEPSIATFLSG